MSCSIAVPGERLGGTEDYVAGQGTYTRGGFIYSKQAGFRKEADNANQQQKRKPILSVELEEKKHLVPEIGMFLEESQPDDGRAGGHHV